MDCRNDSENDDYTWSPKVIMKTAANGRAAQTWDAAKDFSGPAPLKLSAWEKYAQVLLETNEFAFLD